jgi:hypothetical protein
MKHLGGFLALIGGLMIIAAGIAGIFMQEVRLVWEMEFSTLPGYFAIAVVLAVMIFLFGCLSFSIQPRLLGLFILGASFAGIIVGSTLTDIAMLFSVCGGILLFTLPAKPKEKPEEGTSQEQQTQ